ncbi:hypothetical protein J6TS7_33250 [Paenibacillus dendritiformis]|uniref:MerR family transcriptional regulator n=1 Tax=Paenibacillus TaxID=44249 RepID=UPI001B1D7B61|nr:MULTISPECIES: MerR family transcriptional regulator [Paenibacillus]GIO79715.1 hypothetical protein J6TS7_33250 [Paenibacillus dendritiformis]
MKVGLFVIPIQEVTKTTGITVRTLRYYDQIGLLNPAGKTPGGHRLYSDDDLMRLKHIQFLKQTGFRLQEIDEMLAIHDLDWSASLHNQLAYVRFNCPDAVRRRARNTASSSSRSMSTS